MKDLKTCDELLACVMTKLCIPSKVDKVCMTRAFQQMHKSFLKSFYQLEKKHYMSICGRRSGLRPSRWTTDIHRLVILSIIFETASRHGNEGIASMLKDPGVRYKKVNSQLEEYHLSGDTKPLRRSTLASLLPTPNQMPLDILHGQATHTLGMVDHHPLCEREDANMDILATVLEKYMNEDFPLDVIVLIDEEWSEKYEIWKTLKKARQAKSIRKWVRAIKDLSPKYKRYVKYILLLCKRYWQFTCRYACHIKCTRLIKSEGPLKSSMVTFCGYCREFLTYVDMSKRPPSFGHYMNADTLQQLCHRCDSSNQSILPCYDASKFINLEFGHPDRHGFKICNGRRDCFNLVGFPDGRCPNCSHSMTEMEVHKDTCLDNGGVSWSGGWCEGCRLIYERDSSLVVKLMEERKRVESITLQSREDSKKAEVEKGVVKRQRMVDYMKYQFDRALYLKERRRIIKR